MMAMPCRQVKTVVDPFRITCDMCAVSLPESREQRYIKAMNSNNNNSEDDSRDGNDMNRDGGNFLWDINMMDMPCHQVKIVVVKMMIEMAVV